MHFHMQAPWVVSSAPAAQYDPDAPGTDAGIIWLTFEDFVQAFATVFVCR